MRLKKFLPILGATIAFPALLPAAFAPGGVAYTKRADTVLREEPSTTGATVATLKLGSKLTVVELKNRWLRVSESKSTGWIFAGNVSENAPEKDVGLAAIPLDASATTATAAARPLAPAAEEYSTSKDLGKAREDLEWVIEQSSKTTAAEVTAYLQEKKKGEFQ
jgi:hypothetical protein